MTGRTYAKADFEAAREAWLEANLGTAWESFRRQAAERGMLYPPTGTRWDSWEDEHPTQLAIVARAVHNTPDLLTEAIAASSSWSGVVAFLLRRLGEWREDQRLRDRDTGWQRRDEPDPREATKSLAEIIGRIRESVSR